MFDDAAIAVYKLIDIFQTPFTSSELFLNILFIGLIIIISFIIYWDTINVRVSSTSRCKRQMDIYNKNKGMFIINAKDKSKEPLYTITYDTKQNNTNVECTCKSGKYINYFNIIYIVHIHYRDIVIIISIGISIGIIIYNG